MGIDIPKQFLPVNQKAVIFHTIQKFLEYYSGIRIVIALPSDYFQYWQELVAGSDMTFNYKLTKGGTERFNTVQNALEVIEGEGLVAIHDAVRPMVDVEVIRNAFKTAQKHKCAVPVIPVFESVRKKEKEVNYSINREDLNLVQTPQVFDIQLLKKAYHTEYKPVFTDDASVFEAAGHKIHLIEGNKENIKITTPADLKIASVLL